MMPFADSGAAPSPQSAPHSGDVPTPLPPTSLLDSIGDAVAVLDSEWRIRYVNPAAASIPGLTATQLSNGTLWDLLPEATGTPVEDGLRKALLERRSFRFEYYFQTPGVWFEAAAHPADGGVILFLRDITARKHAEEEQAALIRHLRRRVEDFETLIEFLPVGIGIAQDPECRDVRVNQAFSSILGTAPGINVSPDGPNGGSLPFRPMRDGRDLPARELPLQIAAREGREVRDAEVDILRSDGHVLRELCFAQPLFDESGKVRGSIVVVLDVTDRRRAERALKESEENYRFLAEALPQIVWIATTGDEIVYVNSHWLAYTGLTLEESRSSVWRRVVHPDDLPRLLGKASEGRVTGMEAEYRVRRARDGMFRWHMSRARVVTMADGSERWLGTAIDIHDRKEAEEQRAEALDRERHLRRQAEEALELQRQVEQQLLLLVEASSTLIALPDSSRILNTILDLAQRFVGADAYAVWRKDRGGDHWNILAEKGLSESYPRTASDDTGLPMPPQPIAMEDVEAAPLVQSRAGLYRREGIRSMLAVPLTIQGSLDGTIVFYYRAPHRFNDLETRVAGGLANLAAAALGTAELYERQTALRYVAESAERRASFLSEAGKALSSSLEYEATLASVAELAVPGISDWATVDILEETGAVRRVALKHIDPAKIALAEEYSRRFPPDQSGAARQAMRTGRSILFEEIPDSLLQERIADPAQLAFLRTLGLTSLIVAPLVANGRVFGVLTFVTAESGRRFSASDLALAEELAARAATAVENARLYKEQKAAQEALRRVNTELKRANEDLNQFAYSASHDLREPLRMISIYSQMLEAGYRDRLDARATTFLDYMLSGAHRMEMLITDILAYTQAANISEQAITGVSAQAAMEKAIANLEMAIRETGARITSSPLPELLVQEIHLMQLFQNLIGNAIKYRSEEPPQIHIAAEPLGEWWKISIRDNGIGIAPEYADRIFGIFTRLHSGDQYTGTGIGLAICLKIVERYGGEIKVDSREGQGSTFWFTLPGLGAEAGAEAGAASGD